MDSRSYLIFILTLSSLLWTKVQSIYCHDEGQCTGGAAIGAKVSQSYNQCLQDCKDFSGCNYFTFFENTNDCVFFDACYDTDPDLCNHCYSGYASCNPLANCFVPGYAVGTIVSVNHEIYNKDDCLILCKNNYDCEWFTFDNKPGGTKSCILSRDFLEMDYACETCVSGESECEPFLDLWSKLFLVNGYPIEESDTEIIDLSEDNLSCMKPPPFPGPRRGTRGTFIEGKPMVCGGSVSQECYFYDKNSNTWLPAPSMNERRFAPGSTMINESAWWVVGGEEYEYTSEIYVANQGWSYFVDPPIGEQGQCMVKIDDNTFFLGQGLDTYENYLYYLDRNWFQKKGSTDLHRIFCTCGVITRADGSKEVVLAGGGFQGEAYGSSLILNMETGLWRDGPDLPTEATLAAGVQYGNTFLAVGGEYGRTFVHGLDRILKYDVENDDWITLPQKLKNPRGLYTAFLVPDDAVNCS